MLKGTRQNCLWLYTFFFFLSLLLTLHCFLFFLFDLRLCISSTTRPPHFPHTKYFFPLTPLLIHPFSSHLQPNLLPSPYYVFPLRHSITQSPRLPKTHIFLPFNPITSRYFSLYPKFCLLSPLIIPSLVSQLSFHTFLYTPFLLLLFLPF